MTASASPEVIEKQKKLFCEWFKQKHLVDLFFDERGELCIPPRSGRSVPLVAGVAWAAWQEALINFNQPTQG